MHRHTEHQDEVDAQFDALLQRALDEYRLKQEAFIEAIAPFSTWSINDESATLRFTADEEKVGSYQVTPIGTYLPDMESFAWAWANDAIPEYSRSKSEQIRRITEETGYRIFQTPQFRANLNDIDELCALALQALGGVAVFKVKDQTPWVYYVIE